MKKPTPSQGTKPSQEKPLKKARPPSEEGKQTPDVRQNHQESISLLNNVHYPLSTEKSLRLMESENTLVFCVSKNATKAMIQKAIETLLECKVLRVRTFNTHLGEKRAYITFSRDTPAIDIATNLGVM